MYWKKLTSYADSTNMYVGTLTADEMSFAGAYRTSNYAYYLINDYSKNNDLLWWSLSPYAFSEGEEDDNDYAFSLSDDGVFNHDYPFYHYDYSRPAVTLKSSAEIISGNGTKNSPYVIG